MLKSNSIRRNLLAMFLTVFLMTALDRINPFSIPRNRTVETNKIILTWKTTNVEENKRKKDLKYAEANPRITENMPDLTNLLSSKNQQAAQPENVLKKPPQAILPKNEGNSNNLKIVNSSPKNHQHLPPTEIFKEPSSISPKTRKNNLTKLEIKKGIKTDGYSLEKTKKISSEKIINLSKTNSGEKISQEKPKQNITKQKPRPRLSPELINGPTLKNSQNAPRIGKIAIETKLNPYGIYMQQMLKSIEIQWGELLSNSYRFMQKDSLPRTVTYRFILLRDGMIKNLQKIRPSGETLLPAEICRQAIASRAPFGIWDEQMVEEFGEADEISISFNFF